MLSPDDRLVLQVGHLVLAAADFEAGLGTAVWRAAGPRATMLVMGLSMRELQSALRSLTTALQPTARAKLDGILREAEELHQTEITSCTGGGCSR